MPEKLQYFVPFLLYRVMAKGLKQATGDYARLDLIIQEARILIALQQHRKMRAGTLAEVTCIEASALSHLLRRLSRRGLIARQRVQHDNRSVEVGLTEEGQRLARVCSRTSRMHEAVLLKRFSVEERSVVRILLNRMYDNAKVWASNGDALTLTLGKPNSAKHK